MSSKIATRNALNGFHLSMDIVYSTWRKPKPLKTNIKDRNKANIQAMALNGPSMDIAYSTWRKPKPLKTNIKDRNKANIQAMALNGPSMDIAYSTWRKPKPLKTNIKDRNKANIQAMALNGPSMDIAYSTWRKPKPWKTNIKGRNKANIQAMALNGPSMDIAYSTWRKPIPWRTIQYGNKANIQAMAFIQRISKTKPFGWVTSMKDWKDRSTVLEELLALMHHFKGNPDLSDDDWLQFPDLPETIIILRSSRNSIFPYINDPNYFMTRRRKRQTDKEAKKKTNENQTSKLLEPTEKKFLELEGNSNQLILEPYQIQEMGLLFIQLNDLGLLKRIT